MPNWDDYDVILAWTNFILTKPNLTEFLANLFSQHNEHRIVFGNLVTLISYFILGRIDFVALSIFGILGLFASFLLIIYLGKKKQFNLTRIVASTISNVFFKPVGVNKLGDG